jgi:macrodomain Ter protein organizer (MatP/YcbG family)
LRNNNSIIDLTFTTTSIGLLNSWLIEEEYTTPFDHELIVFDWLDLNLNNKSPQNQDIIGWDIDKLIQDEKQLEIAAIYWQKTAINRPLIDNLSNKEDLEEEANWIEKTLINTLNLYAKPLHITARSKRWWNSTVQEARLKYSQAKRRLKQSLTRGSTQFKCELKLARNNYYYIVRKEKRECWQKFLQGAKEVLEDNPTYEDKNRCWTALKYTSSRASSTTPAMKDANGEFTTIIEEKEAIFRKMAFPELIASSINIADSIIHPINAINSFIIEEDIEKALFEQSIKKAPGPDKLNFKALRLL